MIPNNEDKSFQQVTSRWKTRKAIMPCLGNLNEVDQDGITQGEAEATTKAIRALANNMNISLIEAMNLLSIPKGEQQKYLDILEPQCAH